MAEDGLVFPLVEGMDQLVFPAHVSNESLEGSRSTDGVTGRPQAADGVREAGPGVHIMIPGGNGLYRRRRATREATGQRSRFTRRKKVCTVAA
jgi:hypothetical protein